MDEDTSRKAGEDRLAWHGAVAILARALAEDVTEDIVVLDPAGRERTLEQLRPLLAELENPDAERALATVSTLSEIVRGYHRATEKSVGELLAVLHEALALSLNLSGAEMGQTRMLTNTSAAETLQEARTILTALSTRPRVASPATADPLTGLPGRGAAEAAIRAALEGSRSLYIASFYADRIISTNVRFGQAVGDRVLVLASQHIAESLIRPGDTLYRWSGPAFVGLLEREESAPDVASELQQFLNSPVSQYFELPYRTVYLPIRLVGESLRLGSAAYQEVIDGVEKFMHRAAQHR